MSRGAEFCLRFHEAHCGVYELVDELEIDSKALPM